MPFRIYRYVFFLFFSFFYLICHVWCWCEGPFFRGFFKEHCFLKQIDFIIFEVRRERNNELYHTVSRHSSRLPIVFGFLRFFSTTLKIVLISMMKVWSKACYCQFDWTGDRFMTTFNTSRISVIKFMKKVRLCGQ